MLASVEKNADSEMKEKISFITYYYKEIFKKSNSGWLD